MMKLPARINLRRMVQFSEGVVVPLVAVISLAISAYLGSKSITISQDIAVAQTQLAESQLRLAEKQFQVSQEAEEREYAEKLVQACSGLAPDDLFEHFHALLERDPQVKRPIALIARIYPAPHGEAADRALRELSNRRLAQARQHLRGLPAAEQRVYLEHLMDESEQAREVVMEVALSEDDAELQTVAQAVLDTDFDKVLLALQDGPLKRDDRERLTVFYATRPDFIDRLTALCDSELLSKAANDERSRCLLNAIDVLLGLDMQVLKLHQQQIEDWMEGLKDQAGGTVGGYLQQLERKL
ncbi:MAG: hypothetical protein HYV26_06185 [Candidatus Hydrogenedentes bacterium]|nr:hypothetical protein [Candidatus Hydrogenedentota bacterium]